MTDAELERGRKLYASAQLDRVASAFPSLVARLARTDVPDCEVRARLLVRRAKLVRTLFESVKPSPLASAKGVVTIEVLAGGHVTGLELPENRVLTFGSVETQVDESQIVSRTPLSLDDYLAIARERLSRHEERVKPDDALGHFRCAYWAWAYGLHPEAIPHVDATIDNDGFPTIARVFRPKQSRALIAEWSALTDRVARADRAPAPKSSPAPSPAPRPSPVPSPSASPLANPGPGPVPTPSPDARPPVDLAAPEAVAEGPPAAPSPELAPIRELYEKGIARYRDSFGDTKDPDRALADAKRLLDQAREKLDHAPDSPEAESLRVDVQSLLYDVRKRTRI